MTIKFTLRERIQYGWYVVRSPKRLKRAWQWRKRYHLSVCVSCGHFSFYGGSTKTPTSTYWRSIGYALKKPEYAGDCRYLYVYIPPVIGYFWNKLPYKFKSFGIGKTAPWEKPNWKGNK